MEPLKEAARIVWLTLLFSLISINAANSAFIPLLGGLIDYSERAEIRGAAGGIDFNTYSINAA